MKYEDFLNEDVGTLLIDYLKESVKDEDIGEESLKTVMDQILYNIWDFTEYFVDRVKEDMEGVYEE